MADSYTAPPVEKPTGTAPEPTGAVPEPTGAVPEPTGAAHEPTQTRKSNVSSTPDVCLYFLALFIPPLPVLLKRGLDVDFFINILLWIFGWIPGVIHSWYIIAKSEGAI